MSWIEERLSGSQPFLVDSVPADGCLGASAVRNRLFKSRAITPGTILLKREQVAEGLLCMFTVAHRVDSTRATSRELTEWLDAQCEVDSASAHRDQPGRVTGTRELTLPPLPFIIRLSRAARGGGDRQDHPSRVQRWPQTPASRSSSGSARPYPSHLPPAECWSHWQPPGRVPPRPASHVMLRTDRPPDPHHAVRRRGSASSGRVFAGLAAVGACIYSCLLL